MKLRIFLFYSTLFIVYCLLFIVYWVSSSPFASTFGGRVIVASSFPPGGAGRAGGARAVPHAGQARSAPADPAPQDIGSALVKGIPNYCFCSRRGRHGEFDGPLYRG